MKKTMGSNKELFAKIKFSLFRSLVLLCPLFLTLLATKSFAANQITGTVLDADTKAPLKNALVSLKSTGDLVLTNESGTFTLKKTEVNTIKKSRTAPVAPFTLNRNQLQLNITNPNSPVQVVVLNLSGQVIYKTTKILQNGLHIFDLSKFLSTNSTYILQMKINQKNYITKILPLAVRPSGSPVVSSSSVRQSHNLAVSSPETLIVSKYLYTPQTTPVTATNTISLQKPPPPPPPPGMKAIPGGKYMRGSSHSFSNVDERPIKEITISPFFLDSTEVTQADFVALFNTKPWKDFKITNPNSEYPGEGNRYPVWNINWYDAVLYCNERSKRDGLDTAYTFNSINGTAGHGCVLTNVNIDFNIKGYRLPTEAEWEYAARGGTTTEYYWGNYSKQDLVTPTKYALYDTNIVNPVAIKIPNEFGLNDMAGNIYEYVNDYYATKAYNSEDVVDPKGPAGSEYKVLRGGCWGSSIGDVRPANRDAFTPADVSYYHGFRVALPNK